MTVNSIPNAGHPIAGGQRVDPTWYKWLRELDREARDTGTDLSAEIEAIARKLGSPDGTIDGIPESSQSLTALPPLAISGNQITLSTLTADTAGELFGISRDAYGRISALRPVVAGAGITIDGTTDPNEIAIVNGNPNPMTTLGDLIRGDTDGVPERLPVGTNGQVLTVVAGEPEWATSTALVNPMTTAEDLIKGGVGGAPARLGVGTNGQVLTVTAGAVGWATPSGLTNPMTTAGDIITGGASGAPQRLAAGTNGHVLTLVAGAPAWAASGGNASVSGQKAVMELRAADNSSAYSLLGYGGAPIAVGSAGAVSTTTTNAGTATPRVTYFVSTPGATVVAGARMINGTCFIGGGTAGGFVFAGGWMVSSGAATSTHRVFYGLQNANANQTDVNPSTLVNILGFGYDAADTTVQFFHNDGSGTATKVNTGISKPTTNNSAAFRVEISCVSGGSVSYKITEIVSGATFSGTASSDIPAATTTLRWNSYASVGGTSSAIGIDFFGHAITIQ